MDGWDYELRRRLKHKKVSAAVADDWREKKTKTVEHVAAQWRDFARAVVDKWAQQHPLELYLDAVQDVRNQLLNGAKPEIVKRPNETIEIVTYWDEALTPPPEIQNPRTNR